MNVIFNHSSYHKLYFNWIKETNIYKLTLIIKKLRLYSRLNLPQLKFLMITAYKLTAMVTKGSDLLYKMWVPNNYHQRFNNPK